MSGVKEGECNLIKTGTHLHTRAVLAKRTIDLLTINTKIYKSQVNTMYYFILSVFQNLLTALKLYSISYVHTAIMYAIIYVM